MATGGSGKTRVSRTSGALRGYRGLSILSILMGLMSCSQESADSPVEPVEPTMETAIAFSANQNEETVTRATTPLHEKGVNTFIVWGFKNTGVTGNDYTAYQNVIPGYTVRWYDNSGYTTTSNTNGWEYVNQQSVNDPEQTIKYWDWDAKAYRFFGITGGAYSTHEANGAYEVTITVDGSSEENTPYYSHLWISNGGEGQKPFGQPVQLEFIKPLSKVRFMFIFEDPSLASTTELSGKSFAPTNGNTIKTKAQLTISYPLTGTSVAETATFTSEPEGLTAFTQDYYESVTKNGDGIVISPYWGAPENPLENVYTVLPATNQGTYTLTVDVNGEPKTTVVPAEYMNWQLGYQYTYIFKVHVDGGVSINAVQAAFTTWTDHPGDHTIYNW